MRGFHFFAALLQLVCQALAFRCEALLLLRAEYTGLRMLVFLGLQALAEGLEFGVEAIAFVDGVLQLVTFGGDIVLQVGQLACLALQLLGELIAFDAESGHFGGAGLQGRQFVPLNRQTAQLFGHAIGFQAGSVAFFGQFGALGIVLLFQTLQLQVLVVSAAGSQGEIGGQFADAFLGDRVAFGVLGVALADVAHAVFEVGGLIAKLGDLSVAFGEGLFQFTQAIVVLALIGMLGEAEDHVFGGVDSLQGV